MFTKGNQTMARPKTDKTLKQNRRITVNFTETEYAVITKNAEDAGMTKASYIRNTALNKGVSIHYHLTPQVSEMKPVLGQLGRIGSNLNQIARHLNEGGSATDGLKSEIRKAIDELSTTRKSLSELWEPGTVQ